MFVIPIFDEAQELGIQQTTGISGHNMLRHILLIVGASVVFVLLTVVLNFLLNLLGANSSIFLLFSIAASFAIVLLGALYYGEF